MEHPILFSAPMVQAILEGRKTQTRRVLNLDKNPILNKRTSRYRYDGVDDDGEHWFELLDPKGKPTENYTSAGRCPFGAIGHRLWVRETFSKIGCIGWPIDKFEYAYRADFANGKWEGTHDMCFDKWKPSIFMPRAASRILLEITEVSMERLYEISEQDAINEGIDPVSTQMGTFYGNYGKEDIGHALNAKDSFRTLWQSINGVESWNENPFVWVIKFKRCHS
jgi:hypothetical protein